MNRFLPFLDIFGVPVGLNYKKSDVVQTSLGGILSVSFIILIFALFSTKIIEFIEKKNVKSSTITTLGFSNEAIVLHPQDFMFAVKIEQSDFTTNPYFNITWETRDYYNYSNGTSSKARTPLPLEPCTYDHWEQLPSQDYWKETYSTLNLNDFLCPRLSDVFQLQGTYASNHFQFIKLSILECSNAQTEVDLWRPTCKTEAEIQEYLDAGSMFRLLIYTSNFLFNPAETTNYVTPFIEDSLFFTFQRTGGYSSTDISYTKYVLRTDESLLSTKSTREENFLVFEHGNFRQQYYFTSSNKKIAEFYFRQDPKVITIDRSFQKINEIIAYIGGFAQVIIIISTIIVQKYNSYIFSLMLANEIYDFDLRKNNPEGPDKNGHHHPADNKPADHFDPNAITLPNRSNVLLPTATLGVTSFPNNHHRTLNQYEKSSSFQGNQKAPLSKIQTVIEMQAGGNQRIPQNKKNNQRISTRQEDGLIPLNVIKDLLLRQKTEKYIEDHSITSPIQELNSEFAQLDTLSPMGSALPLHRQSNLQPQQQQQQQFEQQLQVQESPQKIQHQITKDIDEEIEKDNNQHQIRSINCKNPMTILSVVPQTIEEIDTDFLPTGSGENPQTQSENQVPTKNNGNFVESNSPLVTQNEEISLTESMHNQKIQFNSLDKPFSKSIQGDFILKKSSQPPLSFPGENEAQQLDAVNNEELINGITNRITDRNSEKLCDIPVKINDKDKQKNKTEVKRNHSREITEKFSKRKQKIAATKRIERGGKATLKEQLLEDLGFKDKQEFLQQEFEHILRRDNSISITTGFIINQMTCGKFCNSEEVQLVDKANEQLRGDLDIRNIITHLKELEKFKELFLSPEQLILFNFFPKPRISMLKDPKNTSISRDAMAQSMKETSQEIKPPKIQKKMTFRKRLSVVSNDVREKIAKYLEEQKNLAQSEKMTTYERLYSAYQQVHQKDDISSINKRLVKMLGQEINQIFEISDLISDSDTNSSSSESD